MLLRGLEIREIPIFSTVFAFAISFFLIEVFRRFAFLGNNRLLRFLGAYSLEIYAIHPVPVAGLRVVFAKLGVENALACIIANLALSSAIPILFAVCCKKLGIHALFFKPYSFFKRLRKREA